LVDLDEILYGGDAIEGDLVAIFFNLSFSYSIMANIKTSEVGALFESIGGFE
jgi:hypothetical protein